MSHGALDRANGRTRRRFGVALGVTAPERPSATVGEEDFQPGSSLSGATRSPTPLVQRILRAIACSSCPLKGAR